MEVQNDIFKLWEVNIAVESKRLHPVGLTRMYDRYENHKISTNNTNIGHKLERTRWSTSPHPPQIHLKNTRIDILMKKGLSRSYVVVQCTHYQHSILYMHYMHKHKSICIYMVYTNPYMHTYECECMLHTYTMHACPFKSTWFHIGYICYFDVIQAIRALVESLVHRKRSGGCRRYYHHMLRRRL